MGRSTSVASGPRRSHPRKRGPCSASHAATSAPKLVELAAPRRWLAVWPADGGAVPAPLWRRCDPVAGRARRFQSACLCAPSRSHPRKRGPCSTLRRAGRIPAKSGARRRAEEGPLWGSDPGDAHGIGVSTTRPRSASRSHPASGSLLHVPPIPAPRLIPLPFHPSVRRDAASGAPRTLRRGWRSPRSRRPG